MNYYKITATLSHNACTNVDRRKFIVSDTNRTVAIKRVINRFYSKFNLSWIQIKPCFIYEVEEAGFTLTIETERLK